MLIELSSPLNGGSTESIEVPEGTTLGDLLAHLGLRLASEAYVLRVNRQDTSPEHRLHDGDWVTVTPRGVKAAYGSRTDHDRSSESLSDLLAEVRAMPESRQITEEEIQAEIEAYRSEHS